MPAPAVVEGFHVLEDRPPGRLPGREAGAVDELALQAAEEGLRRRVVVAVPLAAHGPSDPVPGQDRPVVLTRVRRGPSGGSAPAAAAAAAGPSAGRRTPARPRGGRPWTSRRSRAWPDP